MSGYVASARIVRAAPRLVRDGAVRDGLADGWSTTPLETLIVESAPSLVATTDGFADRVGSVRERWSQLTFFLLDPNSWR